jgi:hypothetical protein
MFVGRKKNVPTGLGPWPRTARWPSWWRWPGAARRKQSRYSGTSWYFPFSWGLARGAGSLDLCEKQLSFFVARRGFGECRNFVPSVDSPRFYATSPKQRIRGFFFLKTTLFIVFRTRSLRHTNAFDNRNNNKRKTTALFFVVHRLILLHSITFWKRSQQR